MYGGNCLNRFIFHIIACVVCIILPVILVIYNYWDIHQPKIGAVGDGKPNYPSLPQLIPPVVCFLMGIGNLPVAIMRYKQNKITQQNESKNDD